MATQFGRPAGDPIWPGPVVAIALKVHNLGPFSATDWGDQPFIQPSWGKALLEQDTQVPLSSSINMYCVFPAGIKETHDSPCRGKQYSQDSCPPGTSEADLN